MKDFLARVRARLKQLHRDQESGAALLEFAIVFPSQLFLTLAIMQFTLIIVAHVMVQHAAFAAARAAVACDVPLQQGQKADPQTAARHAAATVLGTIASDDGNNDPTPADAISWKSSGGGTVTLAHAQGAYGKTTVTLDSGATHVSALVRHDYVLWIPVANKFFAGLTVFGIEGGGVNPASTQRGVSAMRIEKSAFISRPWTPANGALGVGGEVAHPTDVTPPGGP